MKSRKSDPVKRNSKNKHGSRQRKQLRRALRTFETLEKRELLNADWNPDLADMTGFFFDEAGREQTLAYIESRANGGDGSGGGSGGSHPEGGPNDVLTVIEAEPNDGFSNAQHVPLDGNLGVNIAGVTLNPLDEDWYSFDLQAGDIVDGRLTSNVGAAINLPLLSMYNASNRELVSSSTTTPVPAASPLTGSPSAPFALGDVSVHYVVPSTGRYYMRVSDVGTSYSLNLRQYRPVLEQADFDQRQVLFLDFDGAIISRSLFGLGPGSARMSPLTNFLTQYGLQETDEGLFIDEVVRRVQHKFDTLGINTTNSNYGIDIRNSKDHADPWGNEHVSRIVIGGTWGELIGTPGATSGILGIAQSVDPGNFETEETAIVMNDVLIATYPAVPTSAAVPQIDVIAELMTLVIVHEAGHFLGGWHQDPANATLGIMDQFYAPLVSSGSGIDGVFGTADDVPLQFSVDGFSNPGSAFLLGGRNDTINWLGYGLSNGTAGAGTVRGNIFNDRNVNRVLDGDDAPFAGVQVYTDLNGNGVFDGGEFTTTSGADGNYSLQVPSGAHTIRTVVPSGWKLTTADAIPISVAANQIVSNINFGNEQLDQNITGIKWNDINANGLRDVGEGGIQGVWIYIDSDGDNRIDIGEMSTQTAADGTYKLSFPGPGTYTVREVVDPGYVQTFPGASVDNEHTITLTGNPETDASILAGLNFGNTLTVDFGDAPESYGVASHGFTPGLNLGLNWDAEQTSQFSADATGDDVNGALNAGGTVIDDEDGVVLARPLVAGSTNNRISVTAENTTGITSFLQGWVDYNQDGDFNDAGEQILTNVTLGGGTSDITFSAPAGALLGSTVARFRYSATRDVGPTGEVQTGEVEDYRLTVVDTLNIANDDAFTVARNSQLNSLDVLANDFRLAGEQLQILSAGGSQFGGIVQVSNNGTILYTPPNGFIGQDVFTYTMSNSGGDVDQATVTVDVNLFFEDPLAIDDSFDIPTNSIDFPLNVLANDIEGQDGALTIIMVTQPNRGGQISIATGGKSLRYTPARGFGGTEVFTYVVADAAGKQSTAQVTLHTLPGDRADDDVLIQFVATDLSGTPITAIQQGQEFEIQMLVDDLRFDSSDFSNAAGVFAAYTDMLYNLQLVSTVPSTDPNASFNYEVSFFNDYVNFQTGDATIPGIIDEFGAFSSRDIMNDRDPVLLASVRFSARSPGIATFKPDPADEFPFSDTLLFDTPGSAVPIERIRYIGTSLEIVGDGAEFPVAVDDSVPQALPAGTVQFPINVLANDRPGSTGVINLISSTDGISGTTTIDDRGTSNPADDRILYTPNGGFNGADQFTYVIQDTRGIQSTATVTLRVGDADSNDIVGLRLAVTDLNGQEVDEVTVGGQFQLRGFVQDLRGFGVDRGVFAAYEDVLYSSTLVSPVASNTNDPDLGFEVQFGPNYQRVREGDIRIPGIINEIGAVQIENNNQPLGNAEQLLFIVTLTANSIGQASFIGDPADISPLHDTLTFEPPEPVGFDRIRFGFDTVNIVSAGGGGEGFHNALRPFDVNGDGEITPIDALIPINWLNDGGSRYLGGGNGEGESGNPFVDTNGDDYLSPIDALGVINYLNQQTGGNAEGEINAILSSGSLAESSQGVQGDDLVPEVGNDALGTGKIGVRMTETVYGPSRADLATANDSVFDNDDSLDDVLGQIAPEIDENWKKNPFA